MASNFISDGVAGLDTGSLLPESLLPEAEAELSKPIKKRAPQRKKSSEKGKD